MKLVQLKLSNFQCFGKDSTTIGLTSMTYLLGPNGAGKTAVLQALARLFASDLSLRRIRKSDFHVPAIETDPPRTRTLWIEVQFEFPELKNSKGKYATIAGHFAHMKLESADGVPRLRVRLTATMDEDGEIEEIPNYVVQVDDDDTPKKMAPLPKTDRNSIQIHYLPARRDPSDHISMSANALLGRTLRAANWKKQRTKVAELTQSISDSLSGNSSVKGIGVQLSNHWSALHKGKYYADPHVSFGRNEVENLLRHLTLEFSPGHDATTIDFSKLSDGQQSLLYLSLVLSVQSVGREVLAGTLKGFDIEKLRPAVFTMVAMEEPENSLSPHYLGRVIRTLTEFSGSNDAQAIVATHSPSLLRRVPPESVRYLRLNESRTATVSSIILPPESDEAHKFVREAVQAFPELYFSRFVILGEGDSEEVVLPRLLEARGLAQDDSSISVVPLGGRHVNHFWRLLHGLGIPFVTLLDLDLGRYQGGWGRIKYAIDQLIKFPTIGSTLDKSHLDNWPKWDATDHLPKSETGKDWVKFLETAGVFYSSPLDLDFALIRKFPTAYRIEEKELEEPGEDIVVAVLGKSHGDVSQYSQTGRSLFGAYHMRFKLGSKPVAHLSAMAELDDSKINAGLPKSIDRMLTMVKGKIDGLPE